MIKRFIDKEAQFLYVPADKVLETAAVLQARSYDAQGAEYTHQHVAEARSARSSPSCAFELWGKDPALDMVGKIVNHADTSPETSAYKMPEGEGLEAIARGFAILTADDHQKLEWEFPMYDALYAFCQRKATE